MTMNFSSGDVLEHCQLNNMIIAANGDGVLSDPDSTSLAVIARSPAIMGVRVSIGKCRIGDAIESESGTTDLTIEAAHATLYRKDLITYDASANTPAVVKGTDHAGGAGDPIYPPNIPAGDILLAIVEVDAAATTITTGDIYDARVFIVLSKHFHARPDDTLRASDDSTEALSSSPYAKIKSITVPDGLQGALRVKFAINESASGTSYGKIYRDSVAVGTERTVVNVAYETFTEDIDFWLPGDIIELWAYTSGTGNVKEFRVYCDQVEVEEATVGSITW
jgi:hypothetical protein